MSPRFRRLTLSAALLILALSLAWAGVPGPVLAQSQSDSGSEMTLTEPEEQPQLPDKAPGRYFDFSDVLVPNELKLDRSKSFVYDTASFTAGVLNLEGRVEIKSLSRFFVESMTQDNWLLAARFTTPEIVLLFEKPNKRTIIHITETRFKTNVRIWVAPFMGRAKQQMQ
ncbi:MAG: hypothetical protein JRJ59_00060 [Deltaproteobacteria bacterium]|nr:hypothetical protein [Deltaproteobacteria bacterium]